MPPASEAERLAQNALNFSCLRCRQRKVKCDRRNPCLNCTRVGRECNFVPPVRGKPKRRSAPKEGLHAKLKRYEEMLKAYGADIELSHDNVNNAASDGESDDEPEVGMAQIKESESPNTSSRGTACAYDEPEPKTKLITKNGSSRYFDNGIWPNLGDEFLQPWEEGITDSLDKSNTRPSSELFDESPEGLVLSGTFFKNDNLASFHLPFPIVQQLFDIYRDRVDPMMKILHLPTFWSTMINARKNHRDMTKSLEAVIFSFYFITIISLEDEECHSILGEQHSVMTARYKFAARQALINADFLDSSSLMTLQAYLIFLMAMRGQYQNNTLYILSGLAVRLARRMGLHRDGTALKLSPFETDIRRRLWWHVVHVDFKTSDFSGTRPSMDIFLGDVKKPLNIEDEDINPDMTSPPPERIGITPAALCLLRCDLIDFLRQVTPPSSIGLRMDVLTTPTLSLAEKDNLVNQMEDMLESRYVRYCDPSIALHHFLSFIARSTICKMRVFAHNPRQFSNTGAKIPQKSRDILFTNGTKLLQYSNMMIMDPALHKYFWQLSTTYLWDTLHYVLIEVRQRKTGPEVDRAWQLIGQVFASDPRIFADATDTLFAALGNWTLRVWDDYVAARKAEGLPDLPMPEWLTQLCLSRRASAETSSKQTGNSATDLRRANAISNEIQLMKLDGNPTADVETADLFDFPNLLSFDLEPDEWMQWEQIFSGQTF